MEHDENQSATSDSMLRRVFSAEMLRRMGRVAPEEFTGERPTAYAGAVIDAATEALVAAFAAVVIQQEAATSVNRTHLMLQIDALKDALNKAHRQVFLLMAHGGGSGSIPCEFIKRIAAMRETGKGFSLITWEHDDEAGAWNWNVVPLARDVAESANIGQVLHDAGMINSETGRVTPLFECQHLSASHEATPYEAGPMNVTVHALKCWPEPFAAMQSGAKTAEFRRDDREPRFEIGHTLRLMEWVTCEACQGEGYIGDGGPGCESCDGWRGRCTGRELRRLVTHVLRGPAFGVPEGYAMLSLSTARHLDGASVLR